MTDSDNTLTKASEHLQLAQLLMGVGYGLRHEPTREQIRVQLDQALTEIEIMHTEIDRFEELSPGVECGNDE